jgi:peptidoglycan/LPS O-acetylase OafA/YrhL
MLEVVLLFSVVFPVAWLASESQSRRWISVVLGILSLTIVGFVAYFYATISTTFNTRSYFGQASVTLATAIVEELEKGKADKVQRELEYFIKEYYPSYENYPPYDEVVNDVVGRMRTDN